MLPCKMCSLGECWVDQFKLITATNKNETTQRSYDNGSVSIVMLVPKD